MKIIKFLSIVLISTLIYSCSGNRNLVTSDNGDVVITSDTVAYKPHTTIIDSATTIIRDSLLDGDLTETQHYFINNAEYIDNKESYYIYVGDSIEAMVVIYDTNTMVLFTIEQVQKIHNAYRLIDILEELVEKYGIEEEIGMGIINSLTKEVTMLESNVNIKNNRIKEKDIIIKNLMAQIDEMRNERGKQEQINKNLVAYNEDLIKEVKKQKRQKVFIGVGGTILLILTVLAFL